MVAINFTGEWTGKSTKEEQYAEVERLIHSGEKKTTIRKSAPGKLNIALRMASFLKKGGKLQLYEGMRTQHCKLIAVKTFSFLDTPYMDCERKEIRYGSDGGTVFALSPEETARFISDDGFRGREDAFWGYFTTGKHYRIGWVHNNGS